MFERLKRKKHSHKKEKHEKERREKAYGNLPSIEIKTWDYYIPKDAIVLDKYYSKHSKIYIIKEGSIIKYIVKDPQIPPEDIKVLEKEARELVYRIAYDNIDETVIDEILQKLGIHNIELRYLISRELTGFGPLDPPMNDPNLENIECNEANKPLTVTHSDYGRLQTNMIFDSEELDRLVLRLAHMAGKSLSKFNPILDNAMLPGGHRLACSFSTEVSFSSTFAIRKFPEKPWTIGKMLLNKTLNPEIIAWLWMLIEKKFAVLIAGEMGSGKTSLANALCGLIPPNNRIGTAEDIPEFKIPHRNVLRKLTRDAFTIEGTGKIELFDLLKHLLRMNVDYIIVNEIRGEEAKVWMQAISTGHGGITTIHAASPEIALDRLGDLGVTISRLKALYAIVFIQPYYKRIDTQTSKKIRRIRELVDVDFDKNGNYLLTRLFEYNPQQDEYKIAPMEVLLNTRSAKTIMSLNGWSEEDFINDFNHKVKFIKWLYEQCLQNPNLSEPENLIAIFEKYYDRKNFFENISLRETIEGIRIVGIERMKERKREIKIKNIVKVEPPGPKKIQLLGISKKKKKKKLILNIFKKGE